MTSSNLCSVTVNELKGKKLTHTDVYFIVKTRDKEWDSRDICNHILVPNEEAYQMAGFVGYALGHRHNLVFLIETKTDDTLDDLRVEIFFMGNLDDETFDRVTDDVVDAVMTHLLANAW